MIHTLPDVTGTGTTVALASVPYGARWVQVNQISNISGVTARIGDANTGANRGLPIYAQGGQFLPASPETHGNNYVLTGLYVYVGSGDVIAIAYGD